MEDEGLRVFFFSFFFWGGGGGGGGGAMGGMEFGFLFLGGSGFCWVFVGGAGGVGGLVFLVFGGEGKEERGMLIFCDLLDFLHREEEEGEGVNGAVEETLGLKGLKGGGAWNGALCVSCVLVKQWIILSGMLC